ncbi:MAG TPA: hypothetical protein PK228_14875 [Saprospiraceae bacterium]|nr:hypothetical protein [Saprospiraceae bacterium]
MTEEECQGKINALDAEIQIAKLNLQAYVNIPELFENQTKEWLNNQINLNLDKLRIAQKKRQQLLAYLPPEKP